MTTRRRKIHWTNEELARVAAEWRRLKEENPTGLKFDRAVKAQRVLPPERQRPAGSTSAGTIITKAVLQYLEAAPPAAPEEGPGIEVPVVLEQPALTLDELPLGLLVGAVVDRLVATWEGRPMAAAAEKIPATVPVRYVTPREPQRVVVPRIGIIGLKHDQFQQVKERVNGKSAELVFLNKDRNPGALPPSVRYCIVQKHTSHKWYDQAQASVGSERVRFVDGGISGVVSAVNDLLATQRL